LKIPGEILDQLQGVGDRCQDQSSQGNCRHYTWQGQRRDSETITPELFGLDMKCRIKEQDRQKNTE
jgi:hypothetical protein